ncbi:hypothetical protein F5J12DRAFT_788739 [Pisolithus orientalis]|uniref:uncharacterized protein n=1 Tax=Pisolithus orientalis TaxID=936130 RepID=UPI002225500C|nr:uncharacterized protein F5J12DRAFT_788739 [Pisolithus orientalis]KAI5981152.1 hypothetical protein F5J12DRAFT_788739 [Pisolithus orientalis]
MFDTCRRFEDTPWENYIQFWCAQGNTIPYSNKPDTCFLRRSNQIMMTEKPDNAHVVNDWLYNEDSYIPVGIGQSTYPAVEGTGGMEMDEIMKVIPYENSGKPVRVLLDVTHIFCNCGSCAKTLSFNILKRMCHKYLYESKFGAPGKHAFGDVELGKLQLTMKLYVMILAHALVLCPCMAELNLPEEAMAGIEEWPMGLCAAACRARKLDDLPPTGVVTPSGQVIFAGNQMTMPELADWQDSIVHQSASHFRHGIRREYEGNWEGMPEGTANLPNYDGDEIMDYQESWWKFDARQAGTSGASASLAPKWSANPTLTPKGKGKGKGKAPTKHIRGSAGPGEDEGLDLGLFADALDNPKEAEIEEKEVPNAQMEVEPDNPYHWDPLYTGPPFGIGLQNQCICEISCCRKEEQTTPAQS